MEKLMEGKSERFYLAAEDLFLSLLCSFGNWYNKSGRAELHRHSSNFSNSSESPAEMFAHEWHGFIPPSHMRVLQICPILAFLAILLITPVLLVRILSRVDLRQQTRYLLLANVLFSDLLFVCMNILSACINLAGVLMTEWPCAVLLFLSAILYSSGVLSITAMVLDTCFAVLAPFRYLALWPVSRTYGALGAIWVVSVFFPAASIGMFLWYHSTAPCALHLCSLPLLMVLTVSHFRPLHVSMMLTVTGIIFILLMVLSGYIILYFCTRSSGVWKGETSSRARGTFLIHYLHLFLTFCPLLVLMIELMLCNNNETMDPKANLWMSLVVCNVLLILPKALAPYLYGLRYRELCNVLFQFFRLNRPTTITPVI
ncbi:probable G-protein coupled receptor 148 [Sinocyclocheilus grahami]|uniref:probable G-protein coupled receptor 148 n=1 Tax=Sinocyclocheilus grahami TaxID=75366 RepID=UPI0007AD4EFD|nr:PREDICTED: probable G-protein coupled receptor 148 [Sinocyclocheilus grahami]